MPLECCLLLYSVSIVSSWKWSCKICTKVHLRKLAFSQVPVDPHFFSEFLMVVVCGASCSQHRPTASSTEDHFRDYLHNDEFGYFSLAVETVCFSFQCLLLVNKHANSTLQDIRMCPSHCPLKRPNVTKNLCRNQVIVFG